MYYRFENLEVWKMARIFAGEIYHVTRSFPKEEIFSITSQIRRASLSVVLNIAEGSDRKSDIEFIRFLRIAYTSLQEVIAALYIALDQKYITPAQFHPIYQSSHEIAKKINSLITSLDKSPKKE